MILHLSPDAPALLRAAADTALFLHIGGGTVGMLAGTVAMVARKGERLHRFAGNVFFAAMLCMAGVGAIVSPLLPSAPNTVAAILALYLIATAWLAAKRPDGPIGWQERILFLFPVGAIVAGIYFIIVAANSPSGTIDDAPPQAFYMFLVFGFLAAGSDLKVILRGSIAGAARIARHLWRMSTAFFLATGSFFLGQQEIMPGVVRGSTVLLVLAFAPLALLAFWMIRVRFTKWYSQGAAA